MFTVLEYLEFGYERVIYLKQGVSMVICFTIIFVLGLVVGSFLNLCIDRIPKEESVIYPPSHCTNCKNEIKWYDLIPIFSYIFLKGRCRYCGDKLSIRHPMIEFIIGAAYLMIFIKYGLSIDFIKFIIFISILAVIGMIDYDTTDIYSVTTLTGIIAGIIFLGIYIYNGIPIKSYIYGAMLGGGLLALISIVTKGGMGLGDAELCLVCGLFLGVKLTVLMLLLSFIIGSIIGVLLIAFGKKSKKDYIPFGPFIAIAAIITVFWGEKICLLYTSLVF